MKYENPIEHGHLDPEADPSYELNITIHAHDDGDKLHKHKGALGTVYLSPNYISKIWERLGKKKKK